MQVVRKQAFFTKRKNELCSFALLNPSKSVMALASSLKKHSRQGLS